MRAMAIVDILPLEKNLKMVELANDPTGP